MFVGEGADFGRDLAFANRRAPPASWQGMLEEAVATPISTKPIERNIILSGNMNHTFREMVVVAFAWRAC